MKTIKQFVFYGSRHRQTSPAITYDILHRELDNPWKTNLFQNCGSVSHIGIQGNSGVKFCLNGSGDADAISIGGTGVYELDLDGLSYISSLRFIWDNLVENYPGSLSGDNKHLIVDIVCEEEER